jgi:hypothetical protein
MFYGDETLQSLVDHARSFDEQLETFEYLYSLVDDENIKTEEDEPEYDESEAAS